MFETYKPLQRPPVAGPRWCYRCADCLAVMFTGEELQPLFDFQRFGTAYARYGECGVCGGFLEFMGKVAQGAEGRGRLQAMEHRCACDFRCTGALGPKCECSCGGVNHGTGRMVAVVRDLGSIPRTTGLDDYQAAKAAQEYREVRDKLIQERDKYSARKRAGEWLSAGEYERWSALCGAINGAAKNRTHAARMRKLRAAIA